VGDCKSNPNPIVGMPSSKLPKYTTGIIPSTPTLSKIASA